MLGQQPSHARNVNIVFVDVAHEDPVAVDHCHPLRYERMFV